MRVWALGVIVCLSVSCTGPRTSAEVRPLVGGEDVVVLRGGERITGKIVRMDESVVVVESGNRTRVLNRRDVVETSFARGDRNELALSNEAPDAETPKAPPPPTSWFPRTSPKQAVDVVEVTFLEGHKIDRCLGELGRMAKEVPELTLFSQPGGKIIVRDPRKWGYHAHIEPGDALALPQGSPGVTIDIPGKGAPEFLTIVSPAQETHVSGTEVKGYAISDAIGARVCDLSSAPTLLAAQPFAGKPKESPLGPIWAFSLPRNERQCWVYLLDPTKRHDKVLAEVFVGYGDAVLKPDLVIDMADEKDSLFGRVLLVPIPESLPLDGPVPEPFSILAGRDAGIATTVAVPPRLSVGVPPKAPSTKAEVFLTCFDVATSLGEQAVIAHGTAAPDSKITVRKTPLTSGTAVERVSIDLSSLPEDRFPAVAWLVARRTWSWRTGGLREPTGPMATTPPLPSRVRPTKIISNEGRIAHALPILFLGPKPLAAPAGPDADGVVGGMSGALLSDALTRESGAAFQALSSLSGILPLPVPVPTTVKVDGADGTKQTTSPTPAPPPGGDATNVTNIYITIPPHTSLPDITTPVRAVPGASAVGVTYNSQHSGFLPGLSPGSRPILPATYTDTGTGTVYDNYGRVLSRLDPSRPIPPVAYDPRTGESWNPNVGFNAAGGAGFAPGGGYTFRDPVTGIVIPVTRRRQ